MANALYQKFKQELVPALQQTLGYPNPWQVPKVAKVVLNVGYGRFIKEAAFADTVDKTLIKITGQKPVRTKAKKAISNFKIRAGQEIGAIVTLRGTRMYDFLEKLLRVTFPRVRDFHGIPAAGFDGQGNYTVGFKENVAFPEVKMEEIEKIHGLQIIINTTAKNKAEGQALLTALGFPFAK